jgi:hypothetical protein
MNTERRSQFDPDETEALHAVGWRPAPDDPVCPDSSLLLAADDGVLDEALAAQVRAHVRTCATCQLLAKDLAIVLAEDPTVDEATAIRTRINALAVPPRRSTGVWLGLGGLALAAGLAALIFWPRPTPPPAPEATIAKVSPPPSAFIVSRPVFPPGDVELTVRGEPSPAARLATQITAALDAADAGKLAAASVDLERLSRRNPASRAALLALGSLQLRADLNADAVATLEKARLLKAPELNDEIDWFLSIGLVRTGNRDRARVLLDGICKRGGPRGPSACAGVAEIDRTSR